MSERSYHGATSRSSSKIKSLPKHPAHNAVFDNTYMTLSDARPSAIRTFGLRIKQFLTASIIEFSDILETPSLFYLTTEDCAGFGASDKKIEQMRIYQQRLLEIRNIMWHVLQSFHRTLHFP